MTREEALARYRPIRASVQRILRAAISVCTQSDFMRAAKQPALWRDGRIALPEDDMAAEMLSDLALFEQNQRRRRAWASFSGGRMRFGSLTPRRSRTRLERRRAERRSAI